MNAEPHEMRWPDREAGPYRLRVWFATLEGRPAVVGLEMWGAEVDADSKQQADNAYADRGRRLKPGTEQDFEEIPVWTPPGTAIKSSTIRLPLDRMLIEAVHMERARRQAEQRMRPPKGWSEATEAARQAALSEALGKLPKPRRGPHPLPDDLLRRVGDLYREAVSEARRDPAKVVQYRLSDEMRRELKASTVRSWVRVAKERGYLEKPSRSAPRRARRPGPKTTTRSKKP